MLLARALCAISLVSGALACATTAAEPVASPPAPSASSSERAAPRAVASDAPAPVADPFRAQLLSVARAYQAYARVGGAPKWAPTLCKAPVAPRDEVAAPRMSASGDERTHGKKLYFLFASDRASYETVARSPAQPSPTGQVIVKEAWAPREAAGGFVPGDKTGLFIMMKLDSETPGTDRGWVYGTVAADGATVTSSGRVASCMGCHESAPHDRLFGLAR